MKQIDLTRKKRFLWGDIRELLEKSQDLYSTEELMMLLSDGLGNRFIEIVDYIKNNKKKINKL